MSYHCNQKYTNYLLDEIKFNKKAFHQKFEYNNKSATTTTTCPKKSSAKSSSITKNLKSNYLTIIKKLNPTTYTQILLHQEIQQFKSRLRAITREYKLKFGFVPKSFDICEELLIIFRFLIDENIKVEEEEETIERRFNEIINSANLEYENLKVRNSDNVMNSIQKKLLEEIICIFDKIKKFKFEKRKNHYKRKNSLPNN